jgi:hypothetical protein
MSSINFPLKLEEKYEDISGIISEAINRRTTDNTMTKRKRTKGQSTILKTIHIKLKMVLQINRSITQKINKKIHAGFFYFSLSIAKKTGNKTSK